LSGTANLVPLLPYHTWKNTAVKSPPTEWRCSMALGIANVGSMPLDQITLAAFATCNSIRVFAYIPQIRKAAIDKNGASAISYTTWALFLIAHVSTVAYALVNRSDPGLAACFAANALCCVVILATAYWNRRDYARRARLAVGDAECRDVRGDYAAHDARMKRAGGQRPTYQNDVGAFGLLHQ
jgi:hypothetical protein